MSMIGWLPNIQHVNCSRVPNPSVGMAFHPNPCGASTDIYSNMLNHQKVGPLGTWKDVGIHGHYCITTISAGKP